MALPDGTPGLREDRAEFSKRLSRLTQPASDTAALLDDLEALPTAVVLERYARAIAAFGACPELRAAFTRHILASLPPDLPAPPTCDPASEAAQQGLRQAMAALERAEPDTARATSEYHALAQRLASLGGLGPVLTSARADAAAAADLDAAASAWAMIARELPLCPLHLRAKHDAALAAVAAWQRRGEHTTSATERDALSKDLLDSILVAIETEYRAQAATLAEHMSLTRARAAFVRSPEWTPMQPVSAPVPSPVPMTSAEPTPWISRHRPERNLIEIGVLGGVMAPASGLLDDGVGTHQLFNVDKLRASKEATGNSAYKPYRKIAPEIGLRLAGYPLDFLGAELEGGVMPTRVVSSGSPGERATLFYLRAHLTGQIPLWRVTPFILIGGGMLGTTGALGKDVDPSLNFGGGVKFYISRRLMLRVDLRDTVAARKGADSGGAHYPEILLGLSLTLNRRPPIRATPPTHLAPSSSETPGR